jgi:hypothetical protein
LAWVSLLASSDREHGVSGFEKRFHNGAAQGA